MNPLITLKYNASLKSAKDRTSQPEASSICISSLTEGILGCNVTDLLTKKHGETGGHFPVKEFEQTGKVGKCCPKYWINNRNTEKVRQIIKLSPL